MKAFKRFLAGLVLFCLVFTSITPTAYAANVLGEILYENTVESSDVTSFYDLTIAGSGGVRQQFYGVEYTPNNKIVPIVAYGSKIYGRSTITSVADFVRSSGDRVVFGMNADFFSMETGIPMGMLINKGTLISSDDDRAAIGFHEDGSVVIGYPNLTTTITTPSGEVVEITHINKKRTVFGIYLLTPDFSATTRNETTGYDIFLRYSDTLALTVGMTGKYVVDRIQLNTGAVDIPEGYIVVTIDENGPVSDVSKFHVGDTVTLNIETEDSVFEDVAYACGAGDILLEDGEIVFGLGSDKNPRTVLGVKADGAVVFLTVDGRQSGYSTGLSLTDMAKQLQEMGCVSAANLDGGGSTSFVMQYPGESGLTLINSPSDGSLRKCANFIFLVNRTGALNQTEDYFIYPLESKVLKGSTISFDIKATDGNYNATNPPNNLITYLTEGDNAVINDDGSVTFKDTGSIRYNIYDESTITTKQLEVIDKIDKVGIYKEGGNTPLTSLNIGTKESIPLEIKALLNTREIISSADIFTVTVDSTIGTLDENGVFTSGEIMGSSGYITASYGDYETKIKVKIGRAPELIDDFEGNINNWDILLEETREYGHIESNNDSDYVKFGQESAKIVYNYKNAEPENQMTFVMPQNPISIKAGESYISMWVYGDASHNALIGNYLNENGTAYNQTILKSIDFEGWKFVTASLPNDSGLKLRGLKIEHNDTGELSGCIYIDQMVTSQSTPVYNGVPKITLNKPVLNISTAMMVVNGSVLDSNGTPVKKAFISARIDQEQTEFAYDEDSGAIAISFASQLETGLHKITVEATDSLGNITRKSIDYQVDLTDAQKTFADVAGHWSEKYVEYIADKNIVSGVLADGISYYQPDRNVTRAEFCVIMSRFLGYEVETYADETLPFADSDMIPQWASLYVTAMYENGLISGRAAGDDTVLFDPNASLTRAECATIMAKTLENGYGKDDEGFTDSASIPSWAKEGIAKLVSVEVLSGYLDGTVRPNQSIKRSEIAKMIYMLY